MDAATRFRRWIYTTGLLALAGAGCQTVDAGASPPVSRGQSSADSVAPAPVAGAPVSQTAVTGQPVPGSTVPGSPAAPAAPVTGQPVNPGQTVPASYSPEGTAAPSPIPPTSIPRIKVVAVVGAGNIVTDEEVEEAVRQRMHEYLTLVDGPGGKQVVRNDEKEKEIYKQELRRTIERELVLDEMYTRLKKNGKAAIIEEIKEFSGKAADRQMRALRKQWHAESDEVFRSILASQGLTTQVIRRQIERQMMADEYVRSVMKERGKTVGLAEVREYFDQHPDEFRTADRVKWLDLFISFNRYPTPRAAYDAALELQQQAAKGADFVDLSVRHDQGIAGQQKGEGIGQKRGEIQPADVEQTVWSLQAGQVSGLVETPGGYHVVKVVEREVAGARPFDEKTQTEVRQKLMKLYHEREYNRLVSELWRSGVVKVMVETK